MFATKFSKIPKMSMTEKFQKLNTNNPKNFFVKHPKKKLKSPLTMLSQICSCSKNNPPMPKCCSFATTVYQSHFVSQLT